MIHWNTPLDSVMDLTIKKTLIMPQSQASWVGRMKFFELNQHFPLTTLN